MAYFTYYLAWIAISMVAQYPPLLVGLVVFFLVRRWLPDPVVLFRTMGRIQALNRKIEANPANVTARRDLAMVYVERLRPGRALELLDEARKRFPDDPELLYLAGLQSIPTELHEAARIDGANAWQGFWNVTLPLLTPTVFFNVIINIISR